MFAVYCLYGIRIRLQLYIYIWEEEKHPNHHQRTNNDKKYRSSLFVLFRSIYWYPLLKFLHRLAIKLTIRKRWLREEKSRHEALDSKDLDKGKLVNKEKGPTWRGLKGGAILYHKAGFRTKRAFEVNPAPFVLEAITYRWHSASPHLISELDSCLLIIGTIRGKGKRVEDSYGSRKGRQYQ